MSTLTQFLGGKPRRQIVTLTASNASLAIPAWAQGGKGIAYITGCGAGGGGSVHNATGNSGSGGGSGGVARRAVMPILAGATTANVQIGAAAAAASGAAVVAGGNGGDTTVTIGALSLRLRGGNGATSSTSAGSAGGAIANAHTAYSTMTGALWEPITGFNDRAGINAELIRGASGGVGNAASGGFGAGASTPFGQGGDSKGAAPTSNTNGIDATGYGAGGSGATWVSGGNATAGRGGDGYIVIEFVEGV